MPFIANSVRGLTTIRKARNINTNQYGTEGKSEKRLAADENAAKTPKITKKNKVPSLKSGFLDHHSGT